MSFDVLPTNPEPIGMLTLAYTGQCLPLEVLCSAAGHFIGTWGDGPSRESVEYFATPQAASEALESGEWTQRLDPCA